MPHIYLHNRFLSILSGNIACFLLALCASTARSEINYSLHFRHETFGLPDFETKLFVSPNQVIENVQIVLQERVTGGSTSVLASNRISSFEAALTISPSTDGGIRDLLLNTSNGSAGPLNGADYLHYFGAFGASGPQDGLVSTRVSDDVYQALLGWVTIYGPSTGSFTLAVNDPRPAVDGDFGIAGEELFGLESLGTFTGGSLTIAAVPEPSSLILSAVLLGSGLCVRRFSRRSRNSENLAPEFDTSI